MRDILLLGTASSGGGEDTFVNTVNSLLESEDDITHTLQSDSNGGLQGDILHYFNLLRWKFLFPEPEPIYSEERLSEYDLIHAHSNPVAFADDVNVPFVFSTSASNYHYLHDYCEWSKDKIRRRHTISKPLYRILGLHDRALNTSDIDRLLVWTEYPKRYYKSIGYEEDQIDVLYPACRDWGDESTDHEGTNILFVGKHERKGGEIAVEAFKRVMSQFPDADLHYYHPSAAELENEIEGIFYHEYVPNAEFRRDVLPEMDVLVSPTKYESYGYTLIEAQSHGIPVIVTDTPITRDILQSGAKLTDRTVDSFAKALETLLADPDYRAKLGEHARDNYESQFTISDFRRRLFDAYDHAIMTNS